MSQPRPIQAWTPGRGLVGQHDHLAVEEPLEIRLNGQALSITMRTPGHDQALAAGFLLGEGLIRGLADLILDAPAGPRHDAANVVALATATPVDTARVERHFYATSSCGVCGKSSLKALATMAAPVTAPFPLAPAALLALPARLRAAQAAFEATGSLHAAALFGPDGTLGPVYEDVGRHNAVDKAIGARVLADRLPLGDVGLLVSGRTSFEIVQKAVMAGIPLVAAISGPSSLAVELAQRFGVTLVGFLREGRFNVYAGAERLSAP